MRNVVQINPVTNKVSYITLMKLIEWYIIVVFDPEMFELIFELIPKIILCYVFPNKVRPCILFEQNLIFFLAKIYKKWAHDGAVVFVYLGEMTNP